MDRETDSHLRGGAARRDRQGSPGPGRIHAEKEPGERRAAAEEIRKHLREILQSLVPPQDSAARLEIEPPRAAVVIEPEGGREPEVAVHARVLHRGDYLAETTVREERRVYGATRRLTEMGVRERSRRLP